MQKEKNQVGIRLELRNALHISTIDKKMRLKSSLKTI